MITIVPYDPSWPERFVIIGKQLRNAIDGWALGIHHIGSTSVAGLVAKDIIDIQVTVADLEVPINEPLERAGFVSHSIAMDHRPPGNTELDEEQLTKKLYSKPAGQDAGGRTHVHVRVEGRFNQRYPLLCRDYLRTHPMAANAYGEIKKQLSGYFPNDTKAYYAIKDPVFDVFMAGAYEWADYTRWQPGASDA